MLFESSTSVLNIRTAAAGAIVGEMRLGDTIEFAKSEWAKEWVQGTVMSGVSAGLSGFVRRRWLIQSFDRAPELDDVDRTGVASIIESRTAEFGGVRYGLGSKASTWQKLATAGIVDCSGWVYLLGKQVLESVGKGAAAKALNTYSDEQITNAGAATKTIISGHYLKPEHFQPGAVVGIDNSEYSWDRHRALDIDHIVMIGSDAAGVFVSQSSSSGGGVNRVAFDRWWSGMSQLATLGRVHLIDLLAI